MALPLQPLHGREKAAIIVRHAERPPLASVVDSMGVGLTEKGVRDALDFGRSIPFFKKARVWHSPALRCNQTAEAIANGLRERGTEVLVFQEEWNLCGPYVKETECLIQAERLGDRFLREWFEGRVDPGIIDPVPQALHMVLDPIIEKLITAQGIDVHVSHDWDIMLLREALLGTKYETEGWLPYLDGLTILQSGIGFEACYRERCVEVPYKQQE
jgi:broad specificity phosphatase PhoE